VLFLGRIGPQKGLDLLIPAFSKVAKTHRDVHLVLAGPDGKGYCSQVLQWVKDAGLKDRVTFTGYVPAELKLAAYVDSDVYVLPSYGENFGATVTEALACRSPVVISDHVNICDEIGRAQAGVIVQCGVESLAEGIARVLDNAGEAESMGQRGRALVEREFTWEVALGRLTAVYRAVAGKDGRR
jgi:glycosyltransferase involved in cell wall biosynthesis